jgi:hypothetical protein
MGISLGWVLILVAGVNGAPPAGKSAGKFQPAETIKFSFAEIPLHITRSGTAGELTDETIKFSFADSPFQRTRGGSAGELTDAVANCQRAAESDDRHATCRILNEHLLIARQVAKELMNRAKSRYEKGRNFECEALAQRAVEVDPTDVAPPMLAEKARAQRQYKERKQNAHDRSTTLESAFQTTELTSERLSTESPYGQLLRPFRP